MQSVSEPSERSLQTANEVSELSETSFHAQNSRQTILTPHFMLKTTVKLF